jgi:hypothetical protein
MKKSYAFVLAGLLAASGAMAQSTTKRCATSEYLEEQLQQDPQLKSRMEAIEAHTAQILKHNNANQRTGAVVTIPVVVHVVYNTAQQNISLAQIQSQLAVLNEDYRKLNADNANTPAMFAGLSADTEIQFVLATKDPNGNPTTGITRTSTKTRTFTTNNYIKYNSKGGHDAWNTSQYLNFWTAPALSSAGQSLLGYGQFPGGAAATDGVVMAFAAFGSRAKCPSGVYYTGYDLGRTTTHEVGHYLNLRHIWGDATCGNDLVSDTPTQQTMNYGCPTFPHVTCSNQGDMSMNFMDYTDDPCMYMFTAGQKARMGAVLAPGGFHYSLTTSTAASVASSSTNEEYGQQLNAVRDMKIAPNMVFPNPVKAEMNVSYNVAAENANVKVEIYNLMGKLVKTYNEGAKPAGKHIFTISGENDATFSNLSNGMYFVRVNGAAEAKTVRFLIER